MSHTALSLFSILSHLYLTSLNAGNTAFIIQTFIKEEQMGKATCCWSHSLDMTDKAFNPQSRNAKSVLLITILHGFSCRKSGAQRMKYPNVGEQIMENPPTRREVTEIVVEQ